MERARGEGVCGGGAVSDWHILTLSEDSENRMPLLATMPTCMPYSRANPVTASRECVGSGPFARTSKAMST